MLLIFSEMPHPCFPDPILQILGGSRKDQNWNVAGYRKGWEVGSRILSLDFSGALMGVSVMFKNLFGDLVFGKHCNAPIPAKCASPG